MRLLPWLAAAGLGALALHAAAGLGGSGLDVFFNSWLYNLLMMGSALACLARVAIVPEERMAWLLLGGGLLSWSLGDIAWTLFYPDPDTAPYPSLADALYLLFYVASYGGLVLLAKARLRQFHTSLWLDGLIGALTAAAVGAAVFFDRVIATTAGSPAEVATNLAYPLGDALLIVMVVAVFALTGWRPGRSWLLLGASLLANAAADSIYLYQVAVGSYHQGALLDALWPASALLIALAAWQPVSTRPRVDIHGWRMLVVPSAFATVAVGLLVYGQFQHLPPVAALCAGAALLAAILRMALTFRENLRIAAANRHQAITDELTALGNRRRLMMDLQEEVEAATAPDPRLLVYLDLNGFKRYNDAFGHPAGDTLLARLGHALKAAVGPYGRAYRLGGDEFCALVRLNRTSAAQITAACSEALTDRGQAFTIKSSFGTVRLPDDAVSPAAALLLADQRMYAQKDSRRSSAAQQTHDVLMWALSEREPELGDHLSRVGTLARRVGQRLELLPEELDELVRAAELHDIGKIAVPDAILQEPGPLGDEEWGFIRQHTVIGERILSAAPALAPVAKLVRSSHECFDGSGYPDGLAGGDIPLGARIIAACDAYNAMTTERVYQPAIAPAAALAELRRCADRQFDPGVVRALCAEIETSAAAVAAGRSAE